VTILSRGAPLESVTDELSCLAHERLISWYESRLLMLRRLSPFLLVVAILFAAEPLLHHHPLDSGASGVAGNTACAVCATGIGSLPASVAVVGAPQVIEFAQPAIVASFVAIDIPSPRSPRAPPVA
jgi:hypothetical protein